MSCDFDTLKTLLRDKGYVDPAEHAESLRWKLVQAKYYSKLAKDNDIDSIIARTKGNVYRCYQ